MKKLLTFLTLLTLSIGVGWAADVEYKTLTFPDGNSQGVSSYSNSWYATIDGFRWDIINFNNNNNGWNYIKAGSKNYAYVGSITTNSTIDKAITKVVVTVDACTASSINSTSLEVASNNGFSSNLQTVNVTAATGELTYNVPTPTTNQYYRLNFDCKKSSNGVITISKVQYFYSDGSSTPTTYSITGAGTQTGGSVTASATSNITEGTSITITATPSTGYELSNLTVDGNDVTSSVNSSYEYTFNMPAHDVAVSATFTEQSTPQPSGSNKFQRITSTSELEAGKRYLLVYETTPAVMGAISNTSTKYGLSITGSSNFTYNNGVITLTDNTNVEVLTLGGEPTMWTFQLGTKYLKWSSGNSLDTQNDINAYAQWVIQFTDGNAIISNLYNIQNPDNGDVRYLKYNTGSPRFACYLSGQADIQLYKEVEDTPQSNDVYIVGQINGHDSDPWVSTEGVQLTYNSSTDTYGADIYCTGMKNGNDDGYSYFIFVKSLPFDWNTASNFYGSGADGSYWGIGGQGESAFGEAVPLYDGSKNVYRLPAGLYTVSVALSGATGLNNTDKSVTVTKRDVTFSVTSSASFDESKNVTMSSNLTDLGGKIWYTTDGSDPRTQSNSNRHEYTSTLTFTETTNLKAVAVFGCIYSDVVERTYTKKPAAPEISPASCTFNEPLTVTISAENGATIYYTTDGSDPTDQSTQYTGSFTVSTTTTVKAIAYVGEANSNIATATYTYSNVQPSTGDFVLVTSADQLVAGNEYIIVASISGKALSTINTSDKKGTSTTDYELNGTLGESGSTIAPGNAVNILTLGGVTDAWTFQQNDDKYIVLPNSADLTTSNSSGTNGAKMAITITNNKAKIVGEISSTRQLCFRNTTSGVFANYASSNVSETSETYQNIYLYTRATNTVQPPVFSPIAGIYNVDIDVTISCATDGATIYYTTDGTEPSATNGTEYTGEIIVSESTTFKAIAVKGENSSSVVTAAYTIQKSTNIETVTLDYREPFTAGIGKFFITNNTGFSPVWTLDGNFGVKGTSYEPATGTNHAATSRLVSPIIDMTDAVQPEMTFSHQINSYFNDVTTQATLWIRETTNGTNGTWVQLPITFSDPAAAGGWTNDVVDIDLTDVNGVSYAGKKVQISFLYTNPTAGSGAGTWEIQNFVVADNSEYRMVNNIAEFLALENGTKAKFKNPVTVLYDYAQYSSNSYHEYIWVKDESGYMQFYLVPTLNSSTESSLDAKAAYYENGDIIPAGFVVVKNYYENGKYVQAFSAEALEAGFEVATQKGLADPDYIDFNVLNDLDKENATDVATWCNRYITLEKIKLTSKSKSFNFQDENGNENACVGYNKYNGDGSLLKDGVTSADVDMSTLDLTKFYNVKGIIQLWQGGWEFMPIEFTEWKAEEVTLRKLCADGVVNHDYKISNNLLGVYASEDGTKLWVKDDNGQSISPDAPDATYKDNFPINAEGNTRLDQALYDQSNWCEIQLTSENAGDFVGKIIKGGSIDGTFTNKTNPTMTGVTLTNDNIYSDGSYEPNYYIPCNFYGNQSCQSSQHGQPGHGDFFFMTPKPQEYAMVVWAIWDSENDQFVVNENPQYNSHGFQGSFKVDLSLNKYPNIELHDGMDDNFAYNFSAIIRVNSSKAGSDFMVYPLDLSAATDPATAIESVVAGNGEVKSVKYVNVAGMVSDVPFQGVNIVVTEYTDGSRTTTKMLRK